MNNELSNKFNAATLIFGGFLLATHLMQIPLSPFRFESLIVLFLYFLILKIFMSGENFQKLVGIGIFGLLFSLFLSPYGLFIFLFISTFFLRIKNKA
jgi:hypothetical protein